MRASEGSLALYETFKFNVFQIILPSFSRLSWKRLILADILRAVLKAIRLAIHPCEFSMLSWFWQPGKNDTGARLVPPCFSVKECDGLHYSFMPLGSVQISSSVSSATIPLRVPNNGHLSRPRNLRCRRVHTDPSSNSFWSIAAGCHSVAGVRMAT